MDSKPHWHVLGAGAIGCLLACALQRSGHPVTLLLRNKKQPEAGRTSVTLTQNGSEEGFTFPATSQALMANGDEVISHLLVTTKSYDVVSAVSAVEKLLATDSQVLLLTNGMGLAEQLRVTHPELTLYRGITTEGAYRKHCKDSKEGTEPTHVVHAGHGQTRIGGDSQSPPEWFAHWRHAVANSQWDSAIEEALWEKLAVNCVINPLTALHRCHNGKLAEDASLAEQVRQLASEVCQVSYAAGFTKTAQTLPATAARVIEGTAQNRSSMLQDVMQGRRTEIEDITGYLLREAKRYGIPTPCNQQLLERILAL